MNAVVSLPGSQQHLLSIDALQGKEDGERYVNRQGGAERERKSDFERTRERRREKEKERERRVTLEEA